MNGKNVSEGNNEQKNAKFSEDSVESMNISLYVS